jgi:hypothetical protein
VPSLEITQDDGTAAWVEGIDRDTWNAIVPGQSWIDKPAWSAYGTLNGGRMRIVPNGPFPD